MLGRKTGTRPVSFQTTSITCVLRSLGFFSLYFLHFLVLAHYYSTSGGETELFFSDKKNNYYIVGNSALDFDHDHVLVHAHDFGMILHSLLGMLQIQWDGTGDFSLVAHYFVQLLEDMILIENIL